MILSEPLCLRVFVAGKDLSEWTQFYNCQRFYICVISNT